MLELYDDQQCGAQAFMPHHIITPIYQVAPEIYFTLRRALILADATPTIAT